MNLLSEKETINYSGGAKISASFGAFIIGIFSFVYGVIDGVASAVSSCRR